ncbi:MAG: IMPACT family protein [Bacteroidota bacterium]
MKEYYQSIAGPSTGHLREKGSRFLSFAYPVKDEEEIKIQLNALKREYFDATHHCYAWMLGVEGEQYRAFDDGEPGHSAGDPILGQLRSRNLTHVLVVVVRYYGGTNLGVSGLIKAYRGAAALALDAAVTMTIAVRIKWRLTFDYASLPEVMKFAKGTGIGILDKNIGENCELIVETPPSVDPELKFSDPSMIGIHVTCERLTDGR